MKKIIYMAIAAALFAGCKKDGVSDGGPAQQKMITTLQAKDIFYNNATLQGTYDGTGNVSSLGFALSILPVGESNEGDQYLMDKVQTGTFALRVDGLERKMTYYVKAFAINSAGEKIYGNNIIFRTDTMIINPPLPPTGTVATVDGKTVSVTERFTDLGDSGLKTDDRKVVAVRPADIGMYYWTDDQGREKAEKFSLGEAFSNPKLVNTDVIYNVGGLLPGTTYNYILFLKTGAYYNTDKWKTFSQEIMGASGTFTTMTLEDPQARTGNVVDTTPTSAMVAGVLDDNGHDPEVKFGIEYRIVSGTDADYAKVYSLGIDNATLHSYSVFIKGLAPSTEYFYRAFAENDDFNTQSSDVRSFVTNAAGLPVLDSYLLDYDFRVANFTLSSVVIKGKLLSDGGSTLTSKGFYYGFSPQTVMDTKLPVSDALLFDGVYDYFQTTLNALPEGIVYYKPFAVNEHGETVLGETCQIGTAIDGGFLYQFDATIGKKPMYNNMVLSTTRLIYFELDPIISDQTIYYMLDRNLGATIPYDLSFYDQSFVNLYPLLFNAAGYYYQFDRPIPSCTPDVQLTSNMGAAPYWWSQDATLYNPPMNTGDTWLNNNCPEHYVMPTSADLKAIVAAIRPAQAEQTLPNLFQATRWGTTGRRAPANGNMTNIPQGQMVGSDLWVRDAGSNTSNAQLMRIETPPAGTFSIGTAPRYTGRPIRCIRTATIDQTE